MAGFFAGLLLTGLPYWRLPYNADVLSDTATRLGFVGLGVVAALLTVLGIARPGRIFKVMMLPFPLAILLRVIVDTMADPTDHNLWPFEVVFALVVSLMVVVPGMLLGMLGRKALRIGQ